MSDRPPLRSPDLLSLALPCTPRLSRAIGLQGAPEPLDSWVERADALAAEAERICGEHAAAFLVVLQASGGLATVGATELLSLATWLGFATGPRRPPGEPLPVPTLWRDRRVPRHAA